MRKKSTQIIVFLLSFSFIFSARAQTIGTLLSDKETPIYFYGIDFTKAKLIGDAGANTYDIVHRQFAGINDLLLKEASKYDVAGAFRRREVSMPVNLDIVKERNETTDPEKLLSSNKEYFRHLTNADITSLIKGFETGNRSAGTGLLFIVDGMSKVDKAISIWVTLFDIQSRKVLLTERLEGKLGSGFSFRNYWATGIRKVIHQIGDSRYSQWKGK